MTTLDPLTTPNALALLAAIDDGDDSALPILADLLEEAGDPRAAGLRNTHKPDGLTWRHTDVIGDDIGDLLGHVFERLKWSEDDKTEWDGGGKGWRAVAITYHSRSAAFLALAAALAESAS